MTPEPAPKLFPRCEKCDHSWHGLPCTTYVCDCVTSCKKPPIIPNEDAHPTPKE